ncbi:MAG: hypothetical protein AAF581_05755 [Planctomycetota bacterium]
MQRLSLWGILTVALLAGSGCMTQQHTFGNGPQGVEVRKTRQWYAAWGFVPLSDFDSRSVVGASADYRVVNGFGASDVFWNIFTGPVGFFRMTSRVEK